VETIPPVPPPENPAAPALPPRSPGFVCPVLSATCPPQASGVGPVGAVTRIILDFDKLAQGWVRPSSSGVERSAVFTSMLRKQRQAIVPTRRHPNGARDEKGWL
jgi:hypothetical protein